MKKEFHNKLMADAELDALKDAFDSKGVLTFPISQDEALLMTRVLNRPDRGIKGWAARAVSKDMKEYFDGYRNVLYFVESVGIDAVEVSVVKDGLKIEKKSNKNENDCTPAARPAIS